MKRAVVLVLILTAAILLSGCGHYGMGRHYNDNWHNQTISGPQNLNRNTMGYQNGNDLQSHEGYQR